MNSRNQMLARASLILLSVFALGATAKNNPPPLYPNTQPDQEDTYSAEEGDLELPLGVQPNRSELHPEIPFDVTQGKVDQAHGFYSHGTLVNGSVFPLEGHGFVKIFRPRDRGYATYDMTSVVEIAAAKLHHDYPGGEPVQIGDVCGRHGGKLALHASHQNGLDADIKYMSANHHEQDPDTTTGFDELFVKNGKISPNFDEERVWDFIKALHSTGRLVRIFMDPVIKATLCEYAQKVGEYESYGDVLRHIRPLMNHRDHMHVRITCPDKSPECIAQQEVPPGTGCEDVMPHGDQF